MRYNASAHLHFLMLQRDRPHDHLARPDGADQRHPDRRGDQLGQLRWAAARRERPRDRHERPDQQQVGRQRGRRLRNPREHGEAHGGRAGRSGARVDAGPLGAVGQAGWQGRLAAGAGSLSPR